MTPDIIMSHESDFPLVLPGFMLYPQGRGLAGGREGGRPRLARPLASGTPSQPLCPASKRAERSVATGCC